MHTQELCQRCDQKLVKPFAASSADVATLSSNPAGIDLIAHPLQRQHGHNHNKSNPPQQTPSTMPTDQINPLISTQTNALRAAQNVRMSTEHQLPNMTGIRGLERRPTHPGETLRANVLPALGLTQKEFANHLGVSRVTVSELLHEKRGVTPDMAIRLGKLLGNGPRIWLHMQQRVDIWVLEQRGGYESIEQLHVAY